MKSEPAEPAIGEVEVDFLAQAPLRADPKAVSNQQHPHHEFRIHRRAAGVTVKRGEMLTQFCEVEKSINGA